MSWQDLLFLAGSLVTVIVLLPTLRNGTARVPLETSLPKAGLAVVYAGTFYSLNMTLSAIGLLATATIWTLIGRYRAPSSRSVRAGFRSSSGDRSTVADAPIRHGHDGERF